jgi:hypothetical protein
MHPWLRVRKYGFWLAYAAIALYALLFVKKNFMHDAAVYYHFLGFVVWIGGIGGTMVVAYLLMRLLGYAPAKTA